MTRLTRVWYSLRLRLPSLMLDDDSARCKSGREQLAHAGGRPGAGAVDAGHEVPGR
jgi:hypothetical protein